MNLFMIASPILLILLSTQIPELESRIVPQCELARELVRLKVSRTFVSNWVCLAEFESRRNTSLITEVSSLSTHYGIFQIDGKEFCGNGYRGKICNVKCQDLVKDKINDSILCALKIFETRGFQYWDKWMRNCKQNTQKLPDLRPCFEKM